MELPQIGEVITVERGLLLCQYLGLDYLIERLQSRHELYRPFKFDGVSFIPDQYMGIFNNGRGDLITRESLAHDLAFAYGTLAREDPDKKTAEWEVANDRFEADIIKNAGVSPANSRLLRQFVEVGGREALHLPWSWGFAHVNIVMEKWNTIRGLWG